MDYEVNGVKQGTDSKLEPTPKCVKIFVQVICPRQNTSHTTKMLYRQKYDRFSLAKQVSNTLA